MKSSTKAILLICGIVAVLLGVNFIFTSDKGEAEENEQTGNRSSYRATPFGTRAYYTLLQQNAVPVSRLERAFTSLPVSGDPGTLVVISLPNTVEPSEDEFRSLYQWVQTGGLLVIIDREIQLPLPGGVTITTKSPESTVVAKPLQPSVYTRGVKTVKLSPNPTYVDFSSGQSIRHFGTDQGSILSEAPLGKGRVVCLTDPFIVENGGIAQEDNVLLALNLMKNRPPGKVLFDEFHHGYGSSGFLSTGVLGYFKGTPFRSILLQGLLIILLGVFTAGRRFARPLPLRRERRTTSLEFVSSMATLTRLARASDLAMQNVYWDFRRRLCRYCALAIKTETRKLATASSMRLKSNPRRMENLLNRCEQVSSGAQVSESELLDLVTQIRLMEARLR